jgi:hypothetical protein
MFFKRKLVIKDNTKIATRHGMSKNIATKGDRGIGYFGALLRSPYEKIFSFRRIDSKTVICEPGVNRV